MAAAAFNTRPDNFVSLLNYLVHVYALKDITERTTHTYTNKINADERILIQIRLTQTNAYLYK